MVHAKKSLLIPHSNSMRRLNHALKKDSVTEEGVCRFNNMNACYFYSKRANCNLITNSSPYTCQDGSDLGTNELSQFTFAETKRVFQKREKVCSDYNSNSAPCETLTLGTQKKCSYSGGICEECSIDDVCIVTDGIGQKKMIQLILL